MSKKYTGKCLCDEVSFTAVGQPVIVAQCHCEICRRLSGTGHSVGAMFQADAVSIHGNLSEFSYASDKNSTVTKAFCTNCGSPIFGKNTRTPDHVTLALGAFDDASELKIEVVIFERDKQHWDQLEQGISCFREQPDWKPND